MSKGSDKIKDTEGSFEKKKKQTTTTTEDRTENTERQAGEGKSKKTEGTDG